VSSDPDPTWPEKIPPPPFADRSDGSADIKTADAVYGTVPPEQFVPAKKVAAMRGTDFHREAADR
jgi:hypothetical protein